jgi:hypothetical protein
MTGYETQFVQNWIISYFTNRRTKLKPTFNNEWYNNKQMSNSINIYRLNIVQKWYLEPPHLICDMEEIF